MQFILGVSTIQMSGYHQLGEQCGIAEAEPGGAGTAKTPQADKPL
jgi:hypothetical protein